MNEVITGAQIAQTENWVLIIKPDLPECVAVGGYYEHGDACETRPAFLELSMHSCAGARWAR